MVISGDAQRPDWGRFALRLRLFEPLSKPFQAFGAAASNLKCNARTHPTDACKIRLRTIHRFDSVGRGFFNGLKRLTFAEVPQVLLNQIPSKTLTSISELAKRAPDDLLGVCFNFVRQLAQMTSMREDVAGRAWIELLRLEIISVDERGHMYSKRMIKDEYIRQVRAKSGKLGGNPALVGRTNGDVQDVLLNQNPSNGIRSGQAKTKAGANRSSNQNPTSLSLSLSPTKTLVSFGDLSKPGVSTTPADQEGIESVVQEDGIQGGIVDAFDDGHALPQTGGAVLAVNASAPAAGWPPCPHMEIIEIYHGLLPDLPRVRVSRWSAENNLAKFMAARWRQGLESGKRAGFKVEDCAFTTKEEGVKAFEHFFGIVQKSPLLLGYGQEDRKWRADLFWLMRPTNFEKVLQGNYLQEGFGAGRSAQGERTMGRTQASKLGTNGKPYDRFANFSTRGEFARDEGEVEDRRALKFDGSLYLLGEDVVILRGYDDEALSQLLPEYEAYGQVVEVPLDKLPKRVEIMRRCRINGLVNDAPDGVPILPEELPEFPQAKTPRAGVTIASEQGAGQ